jgi:hypothetical protein
VPSVPENFTVTEGEGFVTLSWNKATDDFTPEDAIRYNVYAKAKDGSTVYTYFPVDITTGQLLTSGVRPFINGTSVMLAGFNADDYEFGVQAIDNQNAGGEFASYTPTATKNYKSVDVSVFGKGGSVNILNRSANQVNYEIYTLNGTVLKHGICRTNEQVRQSVDNGGVYLIRLSDGINSKVEKVVLF